VTVFENAYCIGASEEIYVETQFEIKEDEPIRRTVYRAEDGSVVAYTDKNILRMEGMFFELYPELAELIKEDCGVKDVNFFWMR